MGRPREFDENTALDGAVDRFWQHGFAATSVRDAAIGKVIAERLSELEGFFRRCVTAGQHDGSITRNRDAADLARLLLGVVLGIRVLARAKPERALLEGVARPALALLE